jgi:hypothetical protein
MTYTPASNLAYNTIYNVTVGTGARDTGGKNMQSAYSWEFTTAPDTTPPSVTGNTPTGTNVSIATRIDVTFSEAMNQASVQSAFSTIPATTGSFSWNGNKLTYTPASKPAYLTTYSVTIGNGARDLAGNNMTSPYAWQFTTSEQDVTPPTVTGRSPTGINVSIASQINVTFSEAMNQSSAQSAFSTSPATTGSFSWNGNNMTYTPDSFLAFNTTFIVTVGTGARDLVGNNMLSSFTLQFTTIPYTMLPSVLGKTPTGMNVPILSPINVTFSEAMNNASVESAFSISPVTTGSFSWNGNTMKYTPNSHLSNNMTYTVTIGTGAKDLAGNTMAAQYNWAFTTVPQVPNWISNGGFESGSTSWNFYADGARSITLVSPGYEGNNAAMLTFGSGGSNIQLYQDGITLDPNTRYRLSFDAYSNTGHDVTVNLIGIPYAPYGLAYTANLGTSWQTFTTEFTSSGFTGTVSNGRLQFWLTPFAAGGDTYYIDSVLLEKLSAPTIQNHPADQTVFVGQTATFGVVTTGSEPLSYQWQKNGINITDATSETYSIIPLLSDNGSTFRVNVKNTMGSVMSNIATLTVTLSPIAPSIETQPSNQMVRTGHAATFNVVANGTGPLIYQWQKDGVDITGATSSSYTTPTTNLSDNGSTFRVNVINAVGSVMSNMATLIVTLSPIAPSIITQPSNQTVIAGQAATFNVVANGTGPLIYQW